MKDYNPIVIVIFYFCVIGLSMMTNSPIFLVISFFMALLYEMYLIKRDGADDMENGQKTRNILIMFFIVFVFGTLMNGIFTHNGATVLFYIGPNRVTLEAFVYGAVMAFMVVSVITWFLSFGRIMTSDKLIHVFGRFAPTLGLTISMIFRFVPLLRRRYKDIRMGQISLGRRDIKGPINILRQRVKEISILISWSLEASIESADSMAARGYGLPGRSSYKIYSFTKRDALITLFIILITAILLVSFYLGAGRIYYYPEIRFAPGAKTGLSLASAFLFLVLTSLPLAIDLLGDYKWKKSA